MHHENGICSILLHVLSVIWINSKTARHVKNISINHNELIVTPQIILSKFIAVLGWVAGVLVSFFNCLLISFFAITKIAFTLILGVFNKYYGIQMKLQRMFGAYLVCIISNVLREFMWNSWKRIKKINWKEKQSKK